MQWYNRLIYLGYFPPSEAKKIVLPFIWQNLSHLSYVVFKKENIKKQLSCLEKHVYKQGRCDGNFRDKHLSLVFHVFYTFLFRIPYLTNIINKIPTWKLFTLTLMEKSKAEKGFRYLRGFDSTSAICFCKRTLCSIRRLESFTQFFVVMSDCWCACLLNRILLFWNQTLTCVSVRWSTEAKLRRSSPATYCCLEKVLSNRSSCAGVKMVRDLLLDFRPFFLFASRLMSGSVVTAIVWFSFNYA